MRDGLTLEGLRFTPPDLPVAALVDFVRERFGVVGAFKRLSGERDQNFRVTTGDGRRYVVKISSADEPRALVDFQIKALLHIEQQDPALLVPRLIRALDGQPAVTYRDTGGGEHAVRLVTYVPGVPLGEFPPPSFDTINRLGVLQGRLCSALAGFSHAAAGSFMPWDIMNGLVVSHRLVSHYLPEALRAPCAPVLAHLERVALPRMRRLETQVVHNDAHEGNVLCDPDQPQSITGVIDFGDMVKRPLIVDLSTSLASLAERNPDVAEVARALVAGFREQMPLCADQAALLLDAVRARSILTVQLLTFRVRHTAPSTRLVDVDLPAAVRGLEAVLEVSRQQFDAAIDPRVAAEG